MGINQQPGWLAVSTLTSLGKSESEDNVHFRRLEVSILLFDLDCERTLSVASVTVGTEVCSLAWVPSCTSNLAGLASELGCRLEPWPRESALPGLTAGSANSRGQGLTRWQGLWLDSGWQGRIPYVSLVRFLALGGRIWYLSGLGNPHLF